jgi:hypothetical protein
MPTEAYQGGASWTSNSYGLGLLLIAYLILLAGVLMDNV